MWPGEDHIRARVVAVDEESVMEILVETADSIRDALDNQEEWGLAGTRPGQYTFDLVADSVALPILHGAGFSVLSEESGVTCPGRELLAVLDPVDGSTNAHRGIPFWSTSICVLDQSGPKVALVANQATGVRYEAVRGGGATRDLEPIEPSRCLSVPDAIVGISGFPTTKVGWAQFRAQGAASLEMCSVADGVLDAYVVVGGSHLYEWDYLAGMLICEEAGAFVSDLRGERLVKRDSTPRWPIAASSKELMSSIVEQVA